MMSTSTKKLTFAASSAVLGLGIVGAALVQAVTPGALAGSDTVMEVGSTTTMSTAPTTLATPQAEPQIKGPAPLPIEMQGLPG